MRADVADEAGLVRKRRRKLHAVVAHAREAVAERAVGARLHGGGRFDPVRVDRRERLGQHLVHAVHVRGVRGVAHHEALGRKRTVSARHPEFAHRHVAPALHPPHVALTLVRTRRLGDRDESVTVRHLLLVGVVVLGDQLAHRLVEVAHETRTLGSGHEPHARFHR